MRTFRSGSVRWTAGLMALILIAEQAPAQMIIPLPRPTPRPSPAAGGPLNRLQKVFAEMLSPSRPLDPGLEPSAAEEAGDARRPLPDESAPAVRLPDEASLVPWEPAAAPEEDAPLAPLQAWDPSAPEGARPAARAARARQLPALKPRLLPTGNLFQVAQEGGRMAGGFRRLSLIGAIAQSAARVDAAPVRAAAQALLKAGGVSEQGTTRGGYQYFIHSNNTKFCTNLPVGRSDALADGRQVQRLSQTDVVVTSANGARIRYKVSPLAFDLGGKGLRSSAEKTAFDIDGDGALDRIHELGEGVGLLVFDGDRDGRAGTSGLELFGDRTDLDGDGKPDGFADGFAALKRFAVRAVEEGVLAPDALYDEALGARELAALEKAYGLRMRVGGFGGRDLPLAQAGVSKIYLKDAGARRTTDFDGRGNDLLRQAGAAFIRPDGSAGAYADIWFAPEK